MVNDALPEVSRVTVPRRFAPSKNETLPSGVPDDAVTVAVKVTPWPYDDGLSDVPSVVEVLRCPTLCESADEALLRKPASPE